MKIGIVCHASIGGSGTVACELARDLARRGHEVHLLARGMPARLGPLFPGLVFHAVSEAPEFGDGGPTLGLARRIAEIAEAQTLDLVHVHYALGHASAACQAREMLRGRHPLPVITTLHGTDVTLPGATAERREATRGGIAQSDGVTAVSDSLAADCRAIFDLPAVRVISNFIDAHAFNPRRGDPGLAARLRPRGEKLLLHVSNGRPVKRLGDCVEIFARVLRAIPCRLVILGGGPDAGAARMRARQLGVAAHVDFLGEQANVVDYLCAADVLLLPSAQESFGLAALEAMSCGLPVVASRIGGLPEVVEDDVCGRLLPVGDVDAMAAAVVEILRDPGMATTMGLAGRRIASQRFAAESVVPHYLKYYGEVLRHFAPSVADASPQYARWAPTLQP
jgi:N-acetyl-alpha-D-glucosaminyl L-malate synthase BshA